MAKWYNLEKIKFFISYFTAVFVCSALGSFVIAKFFFKNHVKKEELVACQTELNNVREELTKELNACTVAVDTCKEKFEQCVYVIRYLYEQNQKLKGE